MPVQYAIKADVIDLRNDTPQQDDLFLVDSNAWYWTTYTRADFADTRAKVVKVITDDGDYVSVPGIQVFTAHPRVITAAQSQGKLVSR